MSFEGYTLLKKQMKKNRLSSTLSLVPELTEQLLASLREFLGEINDFPNIFFKNFVLGKCLFSPKY